jgi:hypothetical protein
MKMKRLRAEAEVYLGFEADEVVGGGMREFEVLGVEAEAGVRACRALLVAEDGVAEGLAVDAELVGSAGYGF